MSDHAAVMEYEGGYTRLQINRIGLWFFLISEAFMFLALLSSRYLLLGTFRPPEVNQVLGVILTLILLTSSVTAVWGERAIARGDQDGLRRGLLITMLLGVLFLSIVGYEWSVGFAHFPPSTVFGAIFFTLTGMHALHLTSGIIILALVYSAARRGAFTAENHWGVEGSVLYWHFVDAVWLSVFITLYVVG